MKTLNDLDPAVYAAGLAKTIAAQQAKIDNLPDWWQQVVAQLHSQLDKAFPPFYDDALDAIPPWKGRPDKECPVCSEPEDKPHAPDCEYAVLDSLCLAKMAPTRMNLLESEQNGLAQRLVEKIESVSETFMSIGANVHCAEYNADLALDRIEALTARIDAWEQRTELLEQRLEALETKTPC